MNASVVRILGVVSGFLVLSYFGLITSAIALGNPTWTEFVFTSILWVLYVPMIVLGVYFYLRVHTGEALVDKGKYKEAIAYALARQDPSFWLRSHRESSHHMVAGGRAYLALGDSERAHASLWSQEVELGKVGASLVSLMRWRLEWAIEAGDDVAAEEAFEAGKQASKPRGARAALYAAAAEVARSQGDLERCDALLKEATWGADDLPARVALTSALRAADRGDEAQALAWLEAARPRLGVELPWRAEALDALMETWRA